MSILSTPYKKIAAIAALTVGGAFSASAHIPAEHQTTLREYHDFIMKMARPDAQLGPCCSEKDAYINPPEERKPDGSYVITIDTDNYGKRLPQPKKITIPPEKVLSGKFASDFCKTQIAQGSTTCKAPPVGVAWVNPDYAGGEPFVYCYWPRPRMTLGQ